MPNPEQIEDLQKIFEDAELSKDENSADLLRTIRDKLFSIFCSPMKEEYMQEAFKWVSQLCISIGDLSWISSDGKWSHDDAKIFSCIAQLSINELHILIPLIQRHLTSGEEPDVEDGKILARSAKPEDYSMFGDHLVILESVIKCLVEGQKFNDNGIETVVSDAFRGDELGNLLERLKEAMTLICDYLELAHRHWTEVIEQKDSMKFISVEGALRIMCIWLSEDPVGFESQCKRFVIDLIIRNLLLPNRQTKHDLLILGLHSVCSQDEDMLNVLRGIPSYEEALEKYLDYVQSEQTSHSRSNSERRTQKLFKLRCGLIKDLMIK